MIANYHTHTFRCRHAEGADEEYVRCALEAGLQTLGFSDHTPYLFPGSYYSTMRMYPQDLAGYVRSVRQLQAQYAGQIDIRLGVEAEYYPACFDDTLRLLRSQGVEYMILGQHWIGNEEGCRYNGSPTDSEEQLAAYCDQTATALKTGLFSCFAHPDLIRYCGDDAIYRKHITRLCQTAGNCGVPLEINLLGLRTDRPYPRRLFWEIAGEVGNDVILGCDAHSPRDLLDTAAVQKAHNLAEDCRLHLVQTIPLRNIG